MPSPGAGRLPQRWNPISRDERWVSPRRRRTSASHRHAPPPTGEAALRTPGSRPDHAGPGLQPHTGSAPQRPWGRGAGSQGLAAGGNPQDHHHSATWGHCTWPAAPAGALDSSPPQSHPRPTGWRRHSGGQPASLCSTTDRCHASSRLCLGEVSVMDLQDPEDPSSPARPGQAVHSPTATCSILAGCTPGLATPASPTRPRSRPCYCHDHFW